VGQIAGAIITAGLSWGTNARTPPINGSSGVSGVSNFIQTQEKTHQAGNIATVEVTAKMSRTRRAWDWLKKVGKTVGKGVAGVGKGVGAGVKFAFDLFFDSGNTTLNEGADLRRIALGLDKYLEPFARERNAYMLKELYPNGQTWQLGLVYEMNQSRTLMHFNLSGIDDVLGAIKRTLEFTGGATDWELWKISDNPQWWDRIFWWKDGKQVSNPFSSK
jgi:hypothetical protein